MKCMPCFLLISYPVLKVNKSLNTPVLKIIIPFYLKKATW